MHAAIALRSDGREEGLGDVDVVRTARLAGVDNSRRVRRTTILDSDGFAAQRVLVGVGPVVHGGNRQRDDTVVSSTEPAARALSIDVVGHVTGLTFNKRAGNRKGGSEESSGGNESRVHYVRWWMLEMQDR